MTTDVDYEEVVKATAGALDWWTLLGQGHIVGHDRDKGLVFVRSISCTSLTLYVECFPDWFMKAETVKADVRDLTGLQRQLFAMLRRERARRKAALGPGA